MIRRNPDRSIVYPETVSAGRAFPATVAWAAWLFAIPTLPLAYRLWLRPACAQPLSGVPGLTRAELLLLVLALVPLGALALLVPVLAERRRGRDDETGRALREMQDSVSLEGWDRAILYLATFAGPVLLLAGWWGLPETVLCLVIAGGVLVGSRPLPRFPDEMAGPRTRYLEEAIEGLPAPEGEPAARAVCRWRFREHPMVPGVPEREGSFEIPLDRSRYEAAREMERPARGVADWLDLVREAVACPEVILVAARLREIHEKAGYPPYRQVGNVLAFVRQFELESGGERGAGRLRSPVEVLWERKGSGPCLTVLAASLLWLLGFDPALAARDGPDGRKEAALGLPYEGEAPSDEASGARCLWWQPTLPPGGDPARWEWTPVAWPDEASETLRADSELLPAGEDSGTKRGSRVRAQEPRRSDPE